MKRLSLIILAFALLSAFTLIENQPATPITLNGKAFAQGVVIQGGIIAISIEDFSRAAGAPVTLEPSFQIQGNRLLARGVSSGGDYKEYKITQANTAATSQLKYGDATMKIKAAPGQIIAVRKAGIVSNNVMMINGKAYVPLADIVHAFGDGSVRGYTGGTKPGTPINLQTNPNGAQGILVGL